MNGPEKQSSFLGVQRRKKKSPIIIASGGDNINVSGKRGVQISGGTAFTSKGGNIKYLWGTFQNVTGGNVGV